MNQYMLYSLVAYMVGVVVERFEPTVGSVIRIAAAIVFVFFFLVSLRG